MAGLTALGVKSAKPGRHADGRGLYLVVRDTGSRSWVARVQVGGQRRDFGLGSAEVVTLGDARVAAATLRRTLKNGEAPENKARRMPGKVPSFKEAAVECHKAMEGGWRNKRHTDSWLSSLENHVCKHFGSRPVDAVDSVMVRDALAHAHQA